MTQTSQTVAAVRRFNRFYTRAIGALDRAYLGGPYTLAESRVLYEIAHGDTSPTTISAALGVDPGYLSRMLARLARDGLVERRRSPTDGRSVVLRLSERGLAHFTELYARSAGMVETMVGGLTSAQQNQLGEALETARSLLEPEAPRNPIILRPHATGDMGWVTERHGVFYGHAYGWAPKIEAVTARICADFLDNFDPARERCWIAERGGERMGSVFLVKETDTTARLRLLLLEPAARGEGLGRRLVDECVSFARVAGYREIVLWTHEVLTAARAIYAAVGFALVESWVHDDFGRPEVSETWRLVL